MSLRIWARRVAVAAAVAVLCSLWGAGLAQAAGPGSWSQAQVNTAVENGLNYIDSQQNADGSFGTSDPVAETAFAVTAYGVADNGDPNNLTATQKTHLSNAVAYLLAQQQADGSWPNYPTYITSVAIEGLNLADTINAGIPSAVSKGRNWLIQNQQAPPAITGNPSGPACTTADADPNARQCGGWNYDAVVDGFRSDESNTGFALTGLQLTGGVPPNTASFNVDWQRHVQELQATNPFANRNDGGGTYDTFGSFDSNANDTGSLLLGYGFDGVPAADPRVQAAMKFGTDVLDEYELLKPNPSENYQEVAHNGANEDGTCDPASGTCDWYVSGDGGFHYSMWSLTKGFGQYIPANLSDPTNWYAKVVDLLLSSQAADGSWAVNGRDDFTTIVSTSFSIQALGRAGVPRTLTVTKAGTGTGTVTSSPPGINCGSTCSASYTEGSMVTLTATADSGSTFTGWSGAGCSGTGTCTVTMNQDQNVTATFTKNAPQQETLTVTKDGTGTGTVTSSPPGINCGSTCSASFDQGTSVTLTATPDSGSTFAGWSGACTGTGSCTVTMNQNQSVTATFNRSAPPPGHRHCVMRHGRCVPQTIETRPPATHMSTIAELRPQIEAVLSRVAHMM